MNLVTPPPQNSVDSEEEFSLVSVIDLFVDNRWVIGIATAVFFVAAVAYAYIATPIYSADILVQVEDAGPSSGGQSMLQNVSSLFDFKSSAAAEIQVLGSRLVLSKVVEDLQLNIDAGAKRFPLIGSWLGRKSTSIATPGIFGHGGYAWGAESIDVAKLDAPDDLDETFVITALGSERYQITAPDLDRTYYGVVGVDETFQTNLGVITFNLKRLIGNPKTEYTVVLSSKLRAITNLHNALNVSERVRQSSVIAASLEGSDRHKITEILNAIGRRYLQQNVDRKSADAAQSLDFLNQELPKEKATLEAAQNHYTTLQNQGKIVDLTEEAKVALAQNADASTRLLTLQQQRQALSARFGAAHPSIRAIDMQIGQLQQFQSRLNGQLALMPEQQREVVRATLDVQIATALYTSLLNNIQQLQLVKAGKVGSVRLVDTALAPEIPVKPKKTTIVLGGIVAGFLVGVLLAILRNTLFRGLTDPNEIEQRSGLSVYASIPLSTNQLALEKRIVDKYRGVSILSVAHPTDPVVESLRSLRTALQFAITNSVNNVVLITGTAPGVGKSFVSVNFASVLTTAGKRVLLIDGDLRKGYLNQYVGLERKGGFSDYLSGSLSADEIIHRDVIPGLDFISTGVLPPNPAELLLSDKAAGLFEKLSQQYDLVIVDTPPVLVASDTAILASYAGTVFLVVRAERTRMGEIAESAKRLSQNGLKIDGVLFNGLRPELGRFQYGSRYGSYRYSTYDYRPMVDE